MLIARSLGAVPPLNLQHGDISLGSIPQTIPPAINPRRENAEAALSAGLPASSPSIHLDALRGFAAFSVLLNHWRDAFFVDYEQVPNHNPVTAATYLVAGLGHQWVIVFFVMSGYLVGGSVLRSVTAGRWSWRSYLLARLTRLYVVLLPSLLLGAAIDGAGMHIPGTETVYSGQSGMHSLEVDVHATSRPSVLLGNSLFLQTIALPGMGGRRIPAFGSNGPLWSLCNEFWYYMAFPLLVLLVAAGRSRWTRLACGLGLLAWVWFVGWDIVLLGIPWILGASISFLPPIRTSRSWQRGSLIVLALTLLAGGFVSAKLKSTLFSDLVLGVLVTFLIWVTLHCATAPLPAVYTRISRRAAHSSYTLYLVHLPLVIFLKAALHLPRAAPGLHTLAIAAIVLIGALCYAQVVYELFEKNTDRVRKWVKGHFLVRAAA